MLLRKWCDEKRQMLVDASLGDGNVLPNPDSTWFRGLGAFSGLLDHHNRSAGVPLAQGLSTKLHCQARSNTFCGFESFHFGPSLTGTIVIDPCVVVGHGDAVLHHCSDYRLTFQMA
jgi:hypothetical protein